MENENYKVCESCGRKLPESMFSKSYKNRCKECVAEQTRQRRATERTIQGEQTVHPGMMSVQETKELAKTLFTQIIANGESIKKDAIRNCRTCVSAWRQHSRRNGTCFLMT